MRASAQALDVLARKKTSILGAEIVPSRSGIAGSTWDGMFPSKDILRGYLLKLQSGNLRSC